MELNDVLKIGEVCEVSGRMIKAGIYSEKNTEYLNYDGAVIKNVSIGSFVLIRKGFANIVGKVEGEYMKDNVGIPQDIKRIIGIGVLGTIENEKFVHGVTNLPMIGNSVYVITEDVISKIFAKNATDKVTLGTLIGYEEYPFEINVQELLCSHIGIFGNTGSGKSNTLAKLYYEVVRKYGSSANFLNNAKFMIIDFNGEYANVFDNANIYNFSTKISKKNKRGKNTTTSTKLYEIDKNTYIADTPGFSTFDISEIESKDLAMYFKEFEQYIPECEFVGCTHIKEQSCGIKKAVKEGKIEQERYNRFCKIYEELKQKEERKKW